MALSVDYTHLLVTRTHTPIKICYDYLPCLDSVGVEVALEEDVVSTAEEEVISMGLTMSMASSLVEG